MIMEQLTKKVAFKDNIVATENLPFSIVFYPGFYGAFFGFAENKNTQISFCSCTKVAIENYLRFRLSSPIPTSARPSRNFVLDSMYFPQAVVDELIEDKRPQDKNIINFLIFKDKICHECNQVIPSYRYCVEMYGGTFKQNYGWYINKQALEFGILPISNYIIPEICPQEILDLIELDPIQTPKIYRELTNSE